MFLLAAWSFGALIMFGDLGRSSGGVGPNFLSAPAYSNIYITHDEAGQLHSFTHSRAWELASLARIPSFVVLVGDIFIDAKNKCLQALRKKFIQAQASSASMT